MADLNVRSDSVNVEQIMKQIRTRIREKRGSDYTQAELQQLASAKLEQFADPSGLRSDLLEQFRKRGDEPSTYHRHRGLRRWMLMMAHPILKRVQKQVMSDLNLYFEIIHNLVVETTRLGIEVQNLKMRVESLSSRVDFDERRAKSLEGVVQYRQTRPAPSGPAAGGGSRSPGPAGSSVSSAPTGSSVPVSTVSYGNASGNAGSAATAAPSGSSPAGTPGSAAPGGPGASGPAGQGAPGSSRRRRRRRRRRPGNTLAESPNAGSNQQSSSQSGTSAPNNGADHDDGPDGDDDGGDGDEGAPNQ
jgi:hypothetical protein